jgi:hypothetical protein
MCPSDIDDAFHRSQKFKYRTLKEKGKANSRYHAVRTVQRSNYKIVETEVKSIPLTYII